jgi:recombination protein RecA
MPDSKSIDKLREQTEDIYERLSKTDLDVTKFDKKPEPIPRFHSGSYKLNHILGGGWPWGRLIELYGTQSSGKTSIAVHAVKEAQKAGKVCGYVDAEHSLDPTYAFGGIGADRKALLFQQPQSGEQALQCVEQMVEEGVDLVVLDSVAALVPQAELDGDIGDDHVGLLARLMSQTLRRLAPKVLEEDATVIFINQVRSKIGDMFQDETTPGGRALKFYSSIRLRLSPSSHEKEGGETVGNQVYARCAKNKTSPPFRSDKLMITYGEGLDQAFELRGH